MEALRWILLLIGLLLIAGIYWLGRRQGQDRRREGLFERARRAAREDRGRDEPAGDPVEPDLDIGDIDIHGFDVEGRPGEARETPQRSTTARESDTRDDFGDQPVAAGWEPGAPGGRAEADPDDAAEPLPDTGPAPRAQEPGPSDPCADSAPEPACGGRADPSSDPAQEAGAGPEPQSEPEPVVARPGAATEAPEAADAAALGHGATDTAQQDSPEGQRADREAPGRPLDSAAEERVVVLHVVATEGERLVGARLREALESCGMRHGAYSIFHASDSEGSIVFSAANAVEPGTFDRSTMDTLTTPGIALFMQVPGAQAAETVFDRMLSTARAVADALDAHVLDERHSTLTRQTEQHLREELRLLDRRTGSLQR